MSGTGGDQPYRPCEAGCEFEPGHAAETPCGQRSERPGDPCRFCGEPTPDPPPCPKCWQPISIADFRNLFADVPTVQTVVTSVAREVP